MEFDACSDCVSIAGGPNESQLQEVRMLARRILHEANLRAVAIGYPQVQVTVGIPINATDGSSVVRKI